MSTKVNVTTTATKPTVYVAQEGDVTVEVIQNGDVVVDVAYNPVGTTSGDVYGPASSTDNAIARFDGITGKVIQNSGITIADGASGTLSGTNTGDQNLFGTIAVSGQSDIVADSTNDTLTFVAGSNITITTDPSTDAITIASTGGSGSGTVTSVAISGTDGIQVDSGSPITTSGTIQLGVDAPTMKSTLNLAGTNTGDQNVFSTFAVAGQSNVVADSTADTLTLVAGSNITITTDASTDSITINSTASSSGDVVGPASATDNAIARFDQTTGKLIQNSGITIADGATGTLSGTNSGDQNLFGTIAVSGQSNVVADSTNDTLTLVAGSNITITTDAATDSITINSTASGSGDVVGPASANSNDVALFDGTTGKLIKDGGSFSSLIASSTNAATSKTTPVDADEFPLVDSAASYSLKKLTWANLKATAKTYFDTLYQPLATILTTLSGLANSQGVLTNNGSGTLSYTPTSAGGNGPTDSTKIPLFNAEGGINCGDYSNYSGNTMSTWRIGLGTAMAIGVQDFGQGIYSEVNGAFSQAFHAHVTASSTGSQTAFEADITGGSGVNWGLSVLLNPSHYVVYARENISGVSHDRFTIDAQGDLTWYKNGTTLNSGADKTTLAYATPSGTNTITLPAVTGNVVTTGDTGTVTPTMLSDAQLISLAALSYTGNAGKVVAVNGAENNFELISVGGTGTVTSVAISGTDGIEVDSGSPITSAGTIQLGVNAATMKTTLDLSGTNSGDVTLSGTPDYITISGQTITRGLIDLTTDVTGDLPLTNFAQASAASKLLGRGSASGGGDFEEITLGSGLSMSGTTLSASGGGGSFAPIQTVKTDTFSTTSRDGAWADVTGLSVSITPATGKKVLVECFLSCGGSVASGGVSFRVTCNGTVISQGDAASGRVQIAGCAVINQTFVISSTSYSYLHSPASDGSTVFTYQVQISGAYGATYTSYINRTGTDPATYGTRGTSLIRVTSVD